MFALYEKFSLTEKKLFRDVANKLLTYNFLAKNKRDNKEAYYFLLNYKDLFSEYFSVLDLELEVNQTLGAVMLKGSKTSSVYSLKKDESIIILILRLIYAERIKETTLTNEVITEIGEIHEKYDMLEIKKRLNKTDLLAMIRLFRRYNLIDATGDLTNPSTKVVIFPTILYAITTEDIREISNTINSLVAGGINEKIKEN